MNLALVDTETGTNVYIYLSTISEKSASGENTFTKKRESPSKEMIQQRFLYLVQWVNQL